MALKRAPAARLSLVNFKYCFIFNGIFEKQKSAKNKKKNAKTRARETRDVRVYRVRIKHGSGLHEINDFLRRRMRQQNSAMDRRRACRALRRTAEPLKRIWYNTTAAALTVFVIARGRAEAIEKAINDVPVSGSPRQPKDPRDGGREPQERLKLLAAGMTSISYAGTAT
jgi:hypothetical protein